MLSDAACQGYEKRDFILAHSLALQLRNEIYSHKNQEGDVYFCVFTGISRARAGLETPKPR
jgi:hypothetical protein